MPAVPSGVDVALGDLSDVAALGRAVGGCDTVFHLAAKAHDIDAADQPDDFRTVNVDGTANLLQAAAEAGGAAAGSSGQGWRG